MAVHGRTSLTTPYASTQPRSSLHLMGSDPPLSILDSLDREALRTDPKFGFASLSISYHPVSLVQPPILLLTPTLECAVVRYIDMR